MPTLVSIRYPNCRCVVECTVFAPLHVNKKKLSLRISNSCFMAPSFLHRTVEYQTRGGGAVISYKLQSAEICSLCGLECKACV